MLLENSSNKHQDYIIPALFLSCILHIIIAQILLSYNTSIVTPQTFQVELIPSLNQLAKPRVPKIVSPPKLKDIKKEKEKEFLSDIDSNAEKQKLKRGIDPEAGKSISNDFAKSSVTQNIKKTEPKRAMRKLSDLKLDQSTLLKEFSTKPKSSQSSDTKIANIDSYEAFSRPVGSGARFLGLQGNADFLPNLPDGDITMLNTKANRFAVFVRRVATQVFGQLRTSGWSQLKFSRHKIN